MKTFFGDRRWRAAKFLVAVPLWIAFVAAIIWIVKLLWNWLLPDLFAGARPVDYWQAAGLLLLCKILFSGGHGRWRRHRHWDHVTPEEREHFKRRFENRWGERWREASGASRGEADKI